MTNYSGINAWQPTNKGNPKKNSPAFQREWEVLETAVLSPAAGAAQQEIIAPLSSTATSATIYVWGISFASQSTTVNGGKINDSDENMVAVAVGEARGPMFLQLSTPIRITQNSGLYYENVAHQAGSYITIYYTKSTENGELPTP